MSVFKKLITTAAMAGVMAASPAFAADDVRIALVVKALGIGFFEAAAEGAKEAAEELGNVEVIYTGPTDTTAEGQIEVINALIAQNPPFFGDPSRPAPCTWQPRAVYMLQ